MHIMTMDQLQEVRNNEKTSEDQYNRDRHMYQQGKKGLTEDQAQVSSERDRGCYNMGYSARNLS